MPDLNPISGETDPQTVIPKPKPLTRRPTGEKLILFVHGLSGSPEGTWGKMLAVFNNDADLKKYAFDCYGFPTSLIRLPFFGKRSGIRQLASGLATYIQTYHSDKSEIIIVGHSLGGIIARFFIVEQIKAKQLNNVKSLALYAVPNTGAGIAAVGNVFSIRHSHLRQICRNSDLLEGLNVDWKNHNVEESIETIYIVGGQDKIVAAESAACYIGENNVKTIIEHGHRAIVKPINSDDIRFKILKDFVIKTIPITSALSVIDKTSEVLSDISSKPDDVLFDFYTKKVEPYYLNRPIDKMLHDATIGAHAWVSGPSGVGKTVSLKRRIELAEWRLQHIILASYQGLTALELIREICNYLYERAVYAPQSFLII